LHEEALRHAGQRCAGEADIICQDNTDAPRGGLERVYTAPGLPDLTKIEFPRKRNPILDIPSLDLSNLFDFGGTDRADVLNKALGGSQGPVSRLLGSLKGRLATMFMEGGFDFLLKSSLTGQTARAFIRSMFESRLLAFMLENKEAIVRAGSEPLGAIFSRRSSRLAVGAPLTANFALLRPSTANAIAITK